eukprot:maker-scaffold25_size650667-snap-gene-2.11 protein:Tk06697 transcript:maker-scaffold25_size650667-snap-gene-2.11-mRNA-1 annotation:"hypothetical protein F441_12584"
MWSLKDVSLALIQVVCILPTLSWAWAMPIQHRFTYDPNFNQALPNNNLGHDSRDALIEMEDLLRQRRVPEDSPDGAPLDQAGFYYPSFQKKKQNLRRMKELQKLHFQRMRKNN